MQRQDKPNTGSIQDIRIHWDQITCHDYLGMSVVYHAFAYSQEYERRGYTEADRELEFARVASLRPGVARTYFYPHYNCRDIHGPYDMKCARMESVRQWCARMQELNIDVAMQAGWHFPLNTYFGHERADAAVDPEKYAQWIEATMAYLVKDCGFTNIQYLMLFTEPTSYRCGEPPAGWTQWNYYVRVVRAIQAEFARTGLRARLKFVGPNNTFGNVHTDGRYKIEWGGLGGTNLAEAVRELDDCLDIYAAHDYNFLQQPMWEDLCVNLAKVTAATGKPFWLDEFGMQSETLRTSWVYGNIMAQILTASMAAGHQTTMVWSLLDQLFPTDTPLSMAPGEDNTHYNRDSFHRGVHRTGLCRFPPDDPAGRGAPYESWYAYKLLSRAFAGVEGGGVRRLCKCDHGLTVFGGAMMQNDGVTLLAVNTNATPARVRLSVHGTPPGGGRVFRRVFAPHAGLPGLGTEAPAEPRKFAHGVLTDELPAGGFAVYTTRAEL